MAQRERSVHRLTDTINAHTEWTSWPPCPWPRLYGAARPYSHRSPVRGPVLLHLHYTTTCTEKDKNGGPRQRQPNRFAITDTALTDKAWYR